MKRSVFSLIVAIALIATMLTACERTPSRRHVEPAQVAQVQQAVVEPMYKVTLYVEIRNIVDSVYIGTTTDTVQFIGTKGNAAYVANAIGAKTVLLEKVSN